MKPDDFDYYEHHANGAVKGALLIGAALLIGGFLMLEVWPWLASFF